jgi:hypothetical protein
VRSARVPVHDILFDELYFVLGYKECAVRQYSNNDPEEVRKRAMSDPEVIQIMGVGSLNFYSISELANSAIGSKIVSAN